MADRALKSPIFVSIDTPEIDTARDLARQLKGHVAGIKLGLEFFSAHGPQGIAQVATEGQPLFIDLKLHDIPNTVAGAMRAIVALKPDIVTIHAAGGGEMMARAMDAAHSQAAKLGIKPPRVVAVTVLTSLDQGSIESIGVTGLVLDQVVRLAGLALSSGADGVVCSPHEVSMLRSTFGSSPLLVVPGIRPAGSAEQDQKRIMTPAQALEAGADILVIGRPITQAADPLAAVRVMNDSLHAQRAVR